MLVQARPSSTSDRPLIAARARRSCRRPRRAAAPPPSRAAPARRRAGTRLVAQERLVAAGPASREAQDARVCRLGAGFRHYLLPDAAARTAQNGAPRSSPSSLLLPKGDDADRWLPPPSRIRRPPRRLPRRSQENVRRHRRHPRWRPLLGTATHSNKSWSRTGVTNSPYVATVRRGPALPPQSRSSSRACREARWAAPWPTSSVPSAPSRAALLRAVAAAGPLQRRARRRARRVGVGVGVSVHDLVHVQAPVVRKNDRDGICSPTHGRAQRGLRQRDRRPRSCRRIAGSPVSSHPGTRHSGWTACALLHRS